MLTDYMPEKEIAKIANRLQVPLIIADIMNDEGTLTDDVKFGLHEILSDYQPDSALLSIALSALSIANTHKHRAATEDLESLSELLEFAKITLEHSDPQAAQLCKILITQSNAQSIIAQAFLDSMDMGKQDPWALSEDMYDDENIDMGSLMAAENKMEPFYTDNVIAFPGAAN